MNLKIENNIIENSKNCVYYRIYLDLDSAEIFSKQFSTWEDFAKVPKLNGRRLFELYDGDGEKSTDGWDEFTLEYLTCLAYEALAIS